MPLRHQSSARQMTTYSNDDCKHNGGKDRACIGDKRAIMCAECAYAVPNDHELTDMATDNHAPSVR
jgi:ribosomal protein S26